MNETDPTPPEYDLFKTWFHGEYPEGDAMLSASLPRLSGGLSDGPHPAAGSGPRCGGLVDFAKAQRGAWATKQAKGFNTSNGPLEFGLLYGEMAEAFDAWRKGEPDLGEELAHAANFL